MYIEETFISEKGQGFLHFVVTQDCLTDTRQEKRPCHVKVSTCILLRHSGAGTHRTMEGCWVGGVAGLI